MVKQRRDSADIYKSQDRPELAEKELEEIAVLEHYLPKQPNSQHENELNIESISGGTDGSRLSFMGLPCPNLFAGEQAIHSKLEFISVQDLNKAVETMVHLVQVCEEKS